LKLSALVVALIVGLVLAACGGGDEGGSGTTAAQQDHLADLQATADLRDELIRSLERMADAKDEKELRAVETDLERLSARAATLGRGADSSSPEGARLAKGAQGISDAAKSLAKLAHDAGPLYAAAATEREPSVEAQDEVVELAADIEGLSSRLDEPDKQLKRSMKAARAALDGVTPELSSEETSRVAALRVAFSGGAFVDATSAMRDSLAARARSLRGEVASLEPPDVVSDCTSQYEETVSDMSVRNMDCAEADAIIIQAIPVLAPTFSVAGYSCSILGDYGPPGGPILGASDVRCESGEQAFRFSFAD
jgi:hypothetical protein